MKQLFSIFLFLTWASVANAQCEPCQCKSVRMPEIRMPEAKVANCSGVDNVGVPTDLPADLAVLDISHNRYIRALRATDFQNYPDLKLITMQGNVVREISADVFQNLTKLEIVDFSGTAFEEQQIPEVFTDVHNMRKIIGLHVQDIRESMFAGLERLVGITVTIDAETVPEMLFKDLTLHAIELVVPNCHTLPARLFESGAPSLRTVKIVGDRLTAFPDELFQGLSLLHDVFLEADMVHALPDHMLHGAHTSANQGGQDAIMNRFLQMQLGGSVDDLVPEEEKEIYAQLQKLTLLGIDTIGDHVLQELRNLEALIIQRPLEIHPNAFSDLPRLDKFEVSNFNLFDLNSEWFKDLEFLKKLNLSSNHIASIDGGVLSGLHAAELLDLSYNSISKFNSTALDSFRNYIQVLDLSHNNITVLPPSVFIDMYTLQILKLQGNKLKLFPSGLFTESSFYDYDTSLYHPEADYYFPPMKDMMEINLSYNELEEVTFYVFNQMGYLKTIDLSNNAVTDVYLGNVPESLSMEMIDFRNNPLNCSCDLIHISILASKSNAQIFGTCQTPPSLHGIELADLVQYAYMCKPVTVAKVETTESETTTDAIVTTLPMDINDNNVHENQIEEEKSKIPNVVTTSLNGLTDSEHSDLENTAAMGARTDENGHRVSFGELRVYTENHEQETDDIFFTVETDREIEFDYTTPDLMFLNPDEETDDVDAYIHYFNEVSGKDSDTESDFKSGDRSKVTYEHGRPGNTEDNPFKFNRGSNLNEDKLQDLYRAQKPKMDNDEEEDPRKNQPVDSVDDHSGSGDYGFENELDVHVPKQKAVMPAKLNGENDYTWVKIVAGTMGSVGMVSGVVIFVVKMRGILYKWDYNTRRLWHF